MSIIPFLSESPATPSRGFLRWFAIFLLASASVFTVLAWSRPAFLVLGALFVLGSLALVIYAWRFAPANLGRPLPDPVVRSGQPDTTPA